jgi:hypothetical protein
MAPLTRVQRQAHAIKEKIIPAVRHLGETLNNEVPTTLSTSAVVAGKDWLMDYYDGTKRSTVWQGILLVDYCRILGDHNFDGTH